MVESLRVVGMNLEIRAKSLRRSIELLGRQVEVGERKVRLPRLRIDLEGTLVGPLGLRQIPERDEDLALEEIEHGLLRIERESLVHRGKSLLQLSLLEPNPGEAVGHPGMVRPEAGGFFESGLCFLEPSVSLGFDSAGDHGFEARLLLPAEGQSRNQEKWRCHQTKTPGPIGPGVSLAVSK